MHILAAIIGFIGIALFWWYRLKDAGRAAGEISNKIGVVRGNIRRNSLRKKADLSPIAAIDNPLVAAATLLVSTQSEEFVLGDGDEEVIANLLIQLADAEAVEEAMVYAKWAVLQVAESNTVIDKLGKFLGTKLQETEKMQLLEIMREANENIGGCRDFAGSSNRLARKMGLKTDH